MGEVLVLLTGDTSCNSQGLLRSTVYSLVGMHNEKVGCMIVVNGDRHLVRNIEDRIVLGHGEGAFWILKSLEIHEIILRAQESALEVRHEGTCAFQD